MKGNKTITILTVSFNSFLHLKRLFLNLIDKSERPSEIQFLVVDNTNDIDLELKDLHKMNLNIKIIPNNGTGRQRSISHSLALDIGLKYIKTKYCLILDPDTHIFKSSWDVFCVNEIKNKKAVLGAPYPRWKLGKVHDFPSVIFMFFNVKEVRRFDKSFFPFPSLPKKIYNFIFRKVTRIGIFTNKSNLNNYTWLRELSYKLESIFGITSPDTGKDIIISFKLKNYEAINFIAPYSSDDNLKKNKSLSEIAKEYELFMYNDEPIMTHMYSSGVFHWKTKKGSDFKYWNSLIDKVEKNHEN